MAFFGSTTKPNTGVDRSVKVIDNLTGAAVSLGGRQTKINAKPETERLKTEGIDDGGRVSNLLIPGGWMGTIMVDRVNGDADALYSFIEQTYYTGQGQRNYTIVETTRNVNFDNSINGYKYTQAVLELNEPGEAEKKKVIAMGLTFYASERLPV